MRRISIVPAGWLYGSTAAEALKNQTAFPLAGGPLAFTHVQLIADTSNGDAVLHRGSCEAFLSWLETGTDTTGSAAAALSRLTSPRPRFDGLEVRTDRPLVMGIVNVTHDSFYAGSRAPATDAAYGLACHMREVGADIIDIGGESTRPGARPVDAKVELDRVLPVVEKLCADGAVVSIDTRNASVMQAALAVGASIVNDVAALTHDKGAMKVAASAAEGVVLMHMQGRPATMQVAPTYRNVVLEVLGFLEQRVAACEAAGISRARLCVDPGIGFGKTTAQNADLLASLGAFHGLGCAVLVGASRKSFVGAVSANEGPENRLPGSLALACQVAEAGVQIVRVHDVEETKQALRTWRATHWN